MIHSPIRSSLPMEFYLYIDPGVVFKYQGQIQRGQMYSGADTGFWKGGGGGVRVTVKN